MDPFVSVFSALRSLPPLPIYIYQSLLVLFTVCLCAKVLFSKNTKGSLPPGPRGLPLLGNIFQIPKFQWLKYTEWQKEFGPIFSLNFAGNPVIVLNTHEVATELLDRRSATYSSRPRFIMSGEILTGGIFIAFSVYGELWRKLRKAGHEGMNIRAAEKYQPLQEVEAVEMVAAIIKEPDHWDDHLKRTTASSVLSAVYGWPPIESKDDPLVTRINDFAHRIVRAALPGAYLVEILPIMKHLPTWMAPWKKWGLEWYKKDSEMFEGFYDGVAKTMREGNFKPSFTSSLIERQEDHRLSNQEAAWLAGTMFSAGAETTAAALSVFMLAMVLYPNVMRKAQQEIDIVVGGARLPTFADAPDLPYLRAMVKEVLRWRPVGPLGLPRCTTADDWFQGYFIPRGTIVIANVWAMNRDPIVYPDYEEFRPERFIDQEGNEFIPQNTHGQGHVTYGFSRRICLGMHVANNALFINMASILWACNIELERGTDGKPVLPSRTDCIDKGLVVSPVPFKCHILPRSTDIASVLKVAKDKLS
ncbi:hypothetical protein GALMADRAFT_116228 [Galerina marginata CBS 339.88]|uniref:Cytochrome P450 n=1 Tax=Galerina marginata (strain CBS 339.88) TaxID=685588 RepID=A0A067TFQ2_GALM3|nr:hypothetical protein GALMADRAFT_116228 [Galerina marginata CBS 339.88]